MKVLVNSLPKTGTNLLQRCVELAGLQWSGHSLGSSSIFGRYRYVKHFLRKSSISSIPVSIGLDVPVTVSEKWLRSYLSRSKGYVSGHAAYSGHLYQILRSEDFKVVQIIRNPCAMLASWANFIIEPGYYWKEVHNKMSASSFDERLTLMIQGGFCNGIYVTGVRDIFLRAQGWYEEKKEILVVRYEDLVGSRGGGNDDHQRKCIESILSHLEVGCNESKVREIQENLYGGTHTFRKGHIHAWREQINSKIEKSIYDTLNDIAILEKFGYQYDVA